jgi:copper resistance protein C
MLRTALRPIIASLALGLIASPALAHTTVASTTPASGAVLPSSPPEVTIAFHEEARLTSVVVTQAGKPDRKLDFMPTGSAKSFMAHEPMLTDGRNEIKWKALSKDGHPIEGSIIVVIKPGATPSAPAPQADHHDHS